MSGNKVLAIQNSGIETLGNLEKLFESDGYVIESMEAGTLVPDDPTNYSAISYPRGIYVSLRKFAIFD